MKSLVFIILFPIIVFCQSRTGTIRGKVIDADFNYSMNGANVILRDTNLGVAADSNGNYEIKNVPIGKYVLQCSFVGYITQKHTIELTETNLEIIKDFYLGVLKIPITLPDSLKEYHNLFSSYKPNEILYIYIDSISQDNRTLHLTFTNKTNYPIYLIEDLDCYNTVKIIIKNENRKIIRPKLFNECYILPLFLPHKENLIKLEALGSINFPPYKIQDYNLKDLPKGKYFISVKYENKDIQYLPLVYGSDLDYYDSIKYEIEVINQATRGVYFSENEIIINK